MNDIQIQKSGSPYREADLKCGQRFFDKSLADSYDYVEHDEDGYIFPPAEQEWRRGFITIENIRKDPSTGETSLCFAGGDREISEFLKDLNSGKVVPAPRLELEQYNIGSMEHGPDCEMDL
ncbi:hypothetical protein DSECCO2_328250 [anaerobic digester metagenome]